MSFADFVMETVGILFTVDLDTVSLALLFELLPFLRFGFMRWVETSSFSYFSPLTQDNAHIVGTCQGNELWLGRGKLANSSYFRRGQGLQCRVGNVQLCSFGKLLDSLAHLSDLFI